MQLLGPGKGRESTQPGSTLHRPAALGTVSPVDRVSELLLAARSGRYEVVRALIEACEPDIRALCRTIGRSHETDDLVQETLIRVVSSLDSYRGEGSGRSWILGIARHVCADAHRRASRQERIVTRLRSSRARAVASARGNEIELNELLAELDEDQRGAFVLTQVHHLSYKEVALVYDVPIGTIRSRVARARERLVNKIRAAEAS